MFQVLGQRLQPGAEVGRGHPECQDLLGALIDLGHQGRVGPDLVTASRRGNMIDDAVAAVVVVVVGVSGAAYS